MAETKSKEGRWTKRFGLDATFAEEARLAAEVPSEILLDEESGLEGQFSYARIVLPNLVGRDEPLWATDHEWLYVRRPEGVWKTRLPMQHLGRIGVLHQRREDGVLYGGTQIGRNFSAKPRWRRMSLPTSPKELDYPYGFDDAGNEVGPLLFKVVESNLERIVVEAGCEFASPPSAWALLDDGLLATGSDGRVVAYPIAASLSLRDPALRGKLWLRFAIWSNPWAEPIDALVKV